MLRYLKHRFDNNKFNTPVADIRIILSDICAETGYQASLLYDHHREDGALITATKWLQARYGPSVIKRITKSNSNTRLPEGTFSFTDYI